MDKNESDLQADVENGILLGFSTLHDFWEYIAYVYVPVLTGFFN